MVERLKIVGEILPEEKGFFTVKKIAEKTGLPQSDVQTVLDRLFREGLVLRFRLDPKFAPISRGRPAARTFYQKSSKKKIADRVAPKLKEGTAQDHMWSVIRNKQEMDGHFTVRDVIILADVGRENARWFVKMLRRAGIVRQRSRGEWTLIKDPGPKRPYVGNQKRVNSRQ
jgi:DNA-binding Lrp family transcriptional regulator